VSNQISQTALGLMSGTSLDGLDMAICHFEYTSGKWSYTILAAETLAYSNEWKSRLSSAMDLSGLQLSQLDVDLGSWIGEKARDFLNRHNEHAEFIASHGHTVFHQPEHSLTLQIGKGSHIAAATQLPVISDFRSLDVALGGQGAPLVPIGDKLLFGEYDFCLNLGGIANISFELMGQRMAFDICPLNMALDLLARQLDLPFDDSGEIARSGSVNLTLLNQLNSLSFYATDPPKSLGKEWFDQEFYPLLRRSGLSFRDLLSTCTEHMAIQIAQVVKGWNGRMLVTGGGGWNTFLIERIQSHVTAELIVPDKLLVNFKEALIFAFLGVLRWNELANTMDSVTGAKQACSAGVIWLPGKAS